MMASAAGFESLPAAASAEEAPVSSATAALGKSKIEIKAHKWFIFILSCFFVKLWDSDSVTRSLWRLVCLLCTS